MRIRLLIWHSRVPNLEVFPFDIKGLDRTSLTLCRLFYIKYPQICETVFHKLKNISELRELPDFSMKLLQESSSTIKNDISETMSHKFETDPEVLITRLSFSHIREIMKREDPFERFFYEYECIQRAWSVKELKRQIATNIYVRAGISKKPELLLNKLKNKDYSAALTIKDSFYL